MNQDGLRSSWASSSVGFRSKRSTQSSFASSRTSYSSQSSYIDPQVSGSSARASSVQDVVLPGFPEPSDRTVSPEFTKSRLSTPIRVTKTTSEPIRARCSWCGQTFTRRHDFKKHARDFHLSRVYWQCRNAGCQERTCSERQAKLHPNRTGLVDCKNLGSSKTTLLRDKSHFGCPHCSRYYDDAEAFLEHLARDCCPGKAPGSAHQSLQIRALLQQPGLKVLVESYCLQLRGDGEAYKMLWWTWNKSLLVDKIQKLEYGVQECVDRQHPGVARTELDAFLRDLLVPSSQSVFEAQLHRELTSPTPQRPAEKPLPPLPTDAEPSLVSQPYHQESVFQQTRNYLHDRGGQHTQPSQVEAWCGQQQHYDPMIAGSFSEQMEGMEAVDMWQGFGWDHLSDGINFDATPSGISNNG